MLGKMSLAGNSPSPTPRRLGWSSHMPSSMPTQTRGGRRGPFHTHSSWSLCGGDIFRVKWCSSEEGPIPFRDRNHGHVWDQPQLLKPGETATWTFCRAMITGPFSQRPPAASRPGGFNRCRHTWGLVCADVGQGVGQA